LARYTPSGALDPTFGGNGKVTTGFGDGDAEATGVAIQSDDHLVVAGNLFPGDGGQLSALARYTPSGALDPTFGGDGKVTTDFPDDVFIGDIAVQGDGNIVLAGMGKLPAPDTTFLLVRYTPVGALDPTFSENGWVMTRFAGGSAGAFSVALQDDGHIVAGGSTHPSGGVIKLALARYTPSGALDPSFSGNGKVTTAFPGVHAEGEDVAIQHDGKIVAAGTAFLEFRAGDFAVARYLVA
jgi:uncharacterized delta-60 repeat protein